MKVTISETSTWQRTLELKIPREQVEREEKKVLKEYRKKVSVDGFRSGKAPESVVLKRHGGAIRSDAIENVLPVALGGALEESELNPLAPPRVISLDYGEEGPLSVKAVVEVLPDFEVKGWKGLKVEKPVRVIEEADVEEALEQLQDRTAELVTVEREARFGDYLLADILECDASGTPIIGSKSENRTLFLAEDGEGSQVGRQLVGMDREGERRVVVEHGAGAHEGHSHAHQHVFLVQAHEVKEKRLPTLDDEYARALGDFEDLTHLRGVVREDLERQVASESRRLMVGQAIDQLIKSNRVEVPESLIQRYLDGVVEDYRRAAAEQGEQLVSEEPIRQEYRGIATVQIQWQILRMRLADQEEISVAEEEVRAEVDKFAENYNVKPDEAWRVLTTQGRIDTIRNELREQKVVELLLEHAKVKERQISRQEMETPKTEIASPGGAGGGSRIITGPGEDPHRGPDEETGSGSGLILTP